MRGEVDDRSQAGQFILTGSARPHEEASHHSAAMRVVYLDMRPMCLAESRVE
ncbi:MAG: hypothetical protein LBU05_06440 [Bifidobacteriaceae bacterium]|nr:hypothetical protein [Bifidobacteriaceae bacterium]